MSGLPPVVLCPTAAVYGSTLGIDRNLTAGDPGGLAYVAETGGGDQNGTGATSILHGQAGTAASRVATPRVPRNMSPNYCGII